MEIHPAPDSYDPDLVDDSGVVTGYRVLGILGVLLAVFGLISIPFAILPFYQTFGSTQPVGQSGLSGWMLFSTFADTGLFALLLAASAGCLSLRPWSRKGLIFYAVLNLVFSAIDVVLFRQYLLPGPHVTAREAGAVGTFVLILMWPLTVAYSIGVLAYLTQPRTRRLFEQEPATGTA